VLPKSSSAVVTLFGIMKAGAAYVPVDYSAPLERGRRILTDCQVRALIIDGGSLAVIPELPATDASPRPVIVVGGISDPSTAEQTTPFADVIADARHPTMRSRGEDDLAYILYTSGSTGMPKGVMISHRNVLSFVDWCSSVFEPNQHDRFSSHAPFHFDPSVFDLYVATKHGAEVHLIPEDVAKRPEQLARFVATRQLTVWCSTASALTLLVQFGDLEVHQASSLRLVLSGGEVFPIKHLRELQRRWPAPVYYNVYGPTEACVFCTLARIPSPVPEDRETPYPIGFPGSHCSALVLDDEGREVAPGDEGLLHVSGAPVFSGYWNRPADTAAAFLDREGVRWYNTGDVVRWCPADGFTYVARNDNMVKRRGYRIELGEIERALYLHSSVRETAVVSFADADASVKIVAFLSCHDGAKPSIVELKTFCAAKLPSYMNPDRFVFQDRLPRTATDKIDYRALKGQSLDLAASRPARAQID
jgi:amino acid adenylation domain-containing protein